MLSKDVMKAVKDVGYETPTPIQALVIPLVLAGRDVIGQAQTGTGKTAAFAMPLLTNMEIKSKGGPQVLVLTPTRELAIQVAEAFKTYASHIKGFHVVPIYGGQDYGTQLRHLRTGVQVVVGTPGRVMDHMRRGTLDLTSIKSLVLDEADEMLRMGFIDDVEWILGQTPENRQVALFSATMPAPIRKIAEKYLHDPEFIAIKDKTRTAATINQRYWQVRDLHKLDALTRILEAEEFEGMIIFVRTKTATTELADRLEARGFNCAAINGDITQSRREQTIERLKNGKLDILVATDVAARGLDVDRISHVINYDIPYDTESYIHRIGRTGRAGRSGEAILFVSPRENRLLMCIEKATGQKIQKMQLPTTADVNKRRFDTFSQVIADMRADGDTELFKPVVDQLLEKQQITIEELSAVLVKLLQREAPMLVPDLCREDDNKPKPRQRLEQDIVLDMAEEKAFVKHIPAAAGKTDRPATAERQDRFAAPLADGMERFRIEIGRNDGLAAGNLVSIISNKTGLEGRDIQQITIYDDYTTLDMPIGMPRELFQILKKTKIGGQQIRITKQNAKTASSGGFSKRKPAKR